MIVYDNHFVQAISYVAMLCLGIGLLWFVAQVARWDREYESFVIFPMRLAIYALPYLIVPGLGVIVGALLLKKPSRVKRKFALASLYVSTVGLLFWVTLPWTGIR